MDDRFNSPLSEDEQASQILQMVHEDMTVFDREDHQIGRVDQVYFGEVSESGADLGRGAADRSDLSPAPGRTAHGWVEDLAEGLAADDEDVPPVLRNRLLREGFIRVDGAGLFARDRYILPDQIAAVSGDQVRLKVSKDELLKE